MEKPDEGQDELPDRDLVHHHKTDAHQQRNKQHDPQFRLSGQAFFADHAFQMITVQPGMDKPVVQPLGTAGKTTEGQQQKWKGGNQGDNRADGAQNDARAAQQNQQCFFHRGDFPFFFSRSVSVM